MKKGYLKPVVLLVEFCEQDVITASNGTESTFLNYTDNWF